MKFAQSCLTFCDPVDHTVHGIIQTKILEWVVFPFWGMYLQIKVICLNKRKEASVPWDYEADFAEVSHKEVHKALETKPQFLFFFLN